MRVRRYRRRGNARRREDDGAYAWLIPVVGLVGIYLLGRRARNGGRRRRTLSGPAKVEEAAATEAVANGDKFRRFARLGVLDNGLLVAMTLAGVSMEDWIAAKVGVRGYGALVGATVGNAVSDGFAALPEGRKAAAGITAGALLPVIPLFIAMGARRPLGGATSWSVGAAAVAMMIGGFIYGRGVRRVPALGGEWVRRELRHGTTSLGRTGRVNRSRGRGRDR